MNRLEAFANKHGFKVTVREDIDVETDVLYLHELIEFGCKGEEKGIICDPENDVVDETIYRSKAMWKREIARVGVSRPLELTIWSDQQNRLHKVLGLDVPQYRNSASDPERPTSSKWGRILRDLGIKYFDGSDMHISFLFPSTDVRALAIVLALLEIH